jgi:hypothetical protein
MRTQPLNFWNLIQKGQAGLGNFSLVFAPLFFVPETYIIVLIFSIAAGALVLMNYAAKSYNARKAEAINNERQNSKPTFSEVTAKIGHLSKKQQADIIKSYLTQPS